MYFLPAARAALPASTVTQAPVHLPSRKHKKCMDSSQSNGKLIPVKQGLLCKSGITADFTASTDDPTGTFLVFLQAGSVTLP